MAKTAERSGRDGPSPKDVGRHLRQVRKQQGLSRGVVARSAGLTRRELAAYERGRTEVPESDLWCLAGSCGVEVSQLLPQRDQLHISPDLTTIGVGDTIRRLRGPAEPDGLLREYLAMITELRNLPPGSQPPVRGADLAALADALGGTPDAIEGKLTELTGASAEEAARLRAMILPPRSLPSAPTAPGTDPYAALTSGEVPPAVEQFFSAPGPTDPFGAPEPNSVPFAAMPPPEVAWPPPAPVPAPPVPEPVDPMAAPAPFGMPAAPTPMAETPYPPPPAADLFAPPPPAPFGDPLAAPAAAFAPPADADAFPPAPAPQPWPASPPTAAEMVAPPPTPGMTPMPGEAPGSLDGSPSNPFAGPVDAQATAAATLQDPFAPPRAEDPLAPPPLPPDPFAAPPAAADPLAPPPSAADPAVEPPAPEAAAPAPEAAMPTTETVLAPPSGNGHGIVIDDPFAGPAAATPAPTPPPDPIELGPPSDLGIQVLDAIVVDDPMADAPPAPFTPAAPEEPDVAPLPPVSDIEVLTPGPVEGNPLIRPADPIVWNAAETTPAVPPPVVPATAVPPTTEPATVDTGPRFERASAHWQIGGIFPATAMADDGTLALRRADARWALTDLSAPGDCVIEAAFDFRAGSGFGVVFRGSIDDGERITGYSFDVDPIAGGGGYLVRLWEGSRQHWRPLAQAAVTDPAQLYGRHVVRITLRADQLTVLVDGDPVLDLPALSRCTLELGREPCRGDRVGVQAWSTTEVTVESFRVANL